MHRENATQHWLRNGRSPFLIFVIYSLLTIPLTWPTVAHLGSHIPGQLGDAYVHLWTFEWLKFALLSGQNLFETDLIFYPIGVSLLNHNIAWVNFALWLPLQAIFGSEVGYSLAFMLIFPLNGLAIYLLVRELVATDTAGVKTAAFIGGLIGAFWPYNLSHHDHPNLILIAWLPLAMVFLLRLQRHKRWQDAVKSGFFIALIGITRWQLLLIAAPLLGVFFLWLFIQNGRGEIKRLVWHLFGAGGVALLLILPFFTPLLLHQLNHDNLQEVLVEEDRYATDLAAYITPGSYHPLWGEQTQLLTRDFEGNFIYVRFIGIAVLLLAVIGLLKRWRKSWLWLLMTAVYLLLALGPTLHWAGTPTIPLPFRFIEDSFLVQTLRFPDRFNVLMVIPVSLLAAWGVTAVMEKRPFQHYRYGLLLILSGLILFEYANQFQMLSLITPSWFETVAAEKTETAILDIPAFSDEAYNKQYMLYQLVHQKPLVEGRIARPPQAAMQFINSNVLLQNLLSSKLPPAELPNQSQQINQLALAGVDYIILHRQFLSAEELAAWQDWFTRPSHHQDDAIVVYRTDPLIIEQDIPLLHVLYKPDPESKMGLLDLELTEQVQSGNWLTLNAIWGTTAPLNQSLSLCLDLYSTSGQLAQKQCQPVSESWPTSQWQANEIVRAQYQMQVDPFLPSGSYNMNLQLEAAQEPVGQATIAGSLSIEELPRQFGPTMPENIQTAVWQETIRLHGFDLVQTLEQLTLTLHWQAVERPEKSYKFFIHLIDVGSGELVTQADYVPRDWTYPTNWWEAGEYVVDTAVLPLNSVGSGTFRLQIGIYDPDNGERLLATSAENGPTPVDAVIITEINR